MKTVSTINDKRRREPVATRLSATEMTALDAAAKDSGLNRSDWLRRVVQQALVQPSPSSATAVDAILLAEILALRAMIGDLFATAPMGLPTASVIQIMHNADAKKTSRAEFLLRASCDQEQVHPV